MRLLVCGGRDYQDAATIDRALNAVHQKRGITAIVEGGALGADRLARQWAARNQVPVETYEADWQTYGKRAGPWRNHFMLYEGKPDGVVAFPGGKGTADMIAQSEKAGVTVWKIHPSQR